MKDAVCDGVLSQSHTTYYNHYSKTTAKRKQKLQNRK